MSTEENKAVLRRTIADVWNGGNLSVVDELVSPAYIGHDPSFPVTIQGPEGFKQWVMAARTAFPDFHITVEALVAEADTVAGSLTMRGTHQGALGNIPPSGRQVQFGGMFFRRLANGQLVEGWDVADLMGLLQQIGAMPAAEQAS